MFLKIAVYPKFETEDIEDMEDTEECCPRYPPCPRCPRCPRFQPDPTLRLALKRRYL